jgi:hypothetical protein
MSVFIRLRAAMAGAWRRISIAPPTQADQIDDLARQVDALQEAIVAAIRVDGAIPEDQWTARCKLTVAVSALADVFHLRADSFDDDDEDCSDISPDAAAALEHARSRLLCRDIPEALIHIERALPEFLDGLPEAVARHYASRT